MEVLSDDVRVERAWKNGQGMWVSGGVVFTLTKIRKVTALTTEDGSRPRSGASPGRRHRRRGRRARAGDGRRLTRPGARAALTGPPGRPLGTAARPSPPRLRPRAEALRKSSLSLLTRSFP